MAFLILNDAVCFIGGARVSTDKHSRVGRSTQLKTACRQPASQVADCDPTHLKWQEQRTYAAVAAAGVEPGRRLSPEDGDAAADRVAVVRLCQNSPTDSCFIKRMVPRAVSDVRRVAHLPGSEPWRRT